MSNLNIQSQLTASHKYRPKADSQWGHRNGFSFVSIVRHITAGSYDSVYGETNVPTVEICPIRVGTKVCGSYDALQWGQVNFLGPFAGLVSAAMVRRRLPFLSMATLFPRLFVFSHAFLSAGDFLFNPAQFARRSSTEAATRCSACTEA